MPTVFHRDQHVKQALNDYVITASELASQNAKSTLSSRQKRKKENTFLPYRSLFDLGPSLDNTDFIIVDVETTGTGASAHLLEIGAVHMRGTNIVNTFSSLINPGVYIPPSITTLTGITHSLLHNAPTLSEVLSAFNEFAPFHNGEVFVGHNATFDLGFIRRAFHSVGYQWKSPPVVDTLALARRVLPRPVIARHNLATLARYFSVATHPTHRALDDALATAEVLAGLISMVSSSGITHLEDLIAISRPVLPQRRLQRFPLIANSDHVPGVYHFLDKSANVLYVGSSADVRSRLQSYFSSSEKRYRISHTMMDMVASVDIRETTTTVLARIHELRDIARFQPHFNKRSKRHDRHWFIIPAFTPADALTPRNIRVIKRVTSESIPTYEDKKCNTKRQPDSSFTQVCAQEKWRQDNLGHVSFHSNDTKSDTTQLYAAHRGVIGPFPSKKAAVRAAMLMNGSLAAPIPQKIAHDACHGNCLALITLAEKRMTSAAKAQRYEEAADHKRRLFYLMGALKRSRIHTAIACDQQLLVAHTSSPGIWHFLGSSYGRVVFSAHAYTHADIVPILKALDNLWPTVPTPTYLGENALWDEIAIIAELLTQPGTRIISTTCEGAYACRIDGVESFGELWDKLRQ
ncbi:MAG: exonuclease domain-containing protein [Actinomycetaceae bacterium]|nr:exonuclease domain-containing protein [Actinomycetaceae bacterium]